MQEKREQELKEIKTQEKKIIKNIVAIIAGVVIAQILYSLFSYIKNHQEKMIFFHTRYQQFLLPVLVLLFVILLVVCVIVSIVFLQTIKGKIKKWDGISKEQRLEIDKYTNANVIVLNLLVIVECILFCSILSVTIKRELSIFQSVMYLLGFLFFVIMIVCRFILSHCHKRAMKEYDQLFSDGRKQLCETDEEVKELEKVSENEENRVAKEMMKIVNLVFNVGFYETAMVGVFVPASLFASIVIGIMWSIIICCYATKLAKI